MPSQRGWKAAALAAGLIALGVLATVLVLRAAPPAPSPGLRLGVVVKRPDGTAVRGASLAVTATGITLTAQTDARGQAKVRLPANLRDREVLVQAEAPGLARVERKLTVRGAYPGVGLRMPAEAVIGGTVVDETGAPVPGAGLEARGERDPSDAPSRAHAVSDAGGRFALRGLAAGTFAVEARLPLHELAVLPRVQAPTAREGVQVVLVRTSALRGEVWTAAGARAATATVTVAGSGLWPPRSLQTDPQGRFELSPLPAGIYEVRAKLEGAVSVPQEGVVLEPATASFVSLRLAPGSSLRGRVIDSETGAALAKAEVIVVEDALTAVPARSITDAQGGFLVAGLQPRPHRVWARAPGYVSVQGQTADPEQPLATQPGSVRGTKARRADPELVIGLMRAGVVTGSIVDEQGAPVAGAAIELSGTAVDGSPLRVSAAAPLLAGSSVPPPAGDNLGITTGPIPPVPLVALPQGAPGTVSGDGGPAAGLVSDSSGAFRIEGVAPGRVQVVARHQRFAPSRSPLATLVPGGTLDGIRVVMGPGVALAGRVVDVRGYPAAGVRVQLMLEGDPSARVTLSAADGGFAFDALRGTVVVSALPSGAPEVRETLVLDGKAAPAPLVLTLGGEARALAGRVVDARGFPIEGALVRVAGKDPRSPALLSVATGPDGTFRVEGLPPPPYRVEVERAGFGPTVLSAVSPRPREEVSVTLSPSASLAGQVLDRLRGEPIAGASVRLSTRATGTRPRSTTTDAQGRFEFHDITTGDHLVSVQHDGHVSGSASVQLRSGQRSELEPLQLEPAGAISGDVVDRLGAPVPGAQIAVGDPPSWAHATQSDASGHFRLASVEPGTQALSVRHASAGESTGQVAVRVYPQQESPGIVVRLPEAL